MTRFCPNRQSTLGMFMSSSSGEFKPCMADCCDSFAVSKIRSPWQELSYWRPLSIHPSLNKTKKKKKKLYSTKYEAVKG